MTRRARITGRVVGALAVLAALPGLAGCGPIPKPMTALRLEGGQPVLLLASCSDFHIDSVSLYTESGNATAAADGPGRRVTRTGTQVPPSMPLFGPPPAGWSVSEGDLTALAPGQLYGLSGYAGGTKTVTITFTDADLAALGAGEVLVGKAPSSHEKVTEKEFRKRAEDAC